VVESTGAKEALEEHIPWLTAERDRLTYEIETTLSAKPEFHISNAMIRDMRPWQPPLKPINP
jgi:hypothetical protein